MAAPVNTEEFLDLVRRSEVLDDSRLDSFAASLNGSGTALAEPKDLATQMVSEGLLTTFQAKQLLVGKWRRFRISGKYKLLELIGAGGMGAVYLCKHVLMDRLVALKILPFDKLADPSSVQRFYREARAVAALDHKNIVRAHDIDQDGDKLHFLVMEYVDGSSLQEIVARHGRMDPIRAANYIKQAAEGLQHAHEANLVHRDIKPGNILIDRTGTVKILDLGLARFFDSRKDNVTEKYDEGSTLGTADYLAPEQAMHTTVDIRADIYGLGATFFFMLTGRAPFEDGTLTQKLLWHQVKKVQLVSEFRNDVPPELVAVICKMLAKAPSDRYETPKALAEALAPWTQEPVEPPPADWMPKRSLAATSGAQGDAPLVPSGPSTRSVLPPRSAPPSRSNGSTPMPKTTLSSAVSRPASKPVERGEPVRRFKRKPKPPSTAKLVAMIAGGSAVSLGLIFGVVALFSGKKGDSKPQSTQNAAAAPGNPTARPAPVPTSVDIIPPERARDYLGKYCTVEMTVRHVGKASTSARWFLNSKDDYRDNTNFNVTFTQKVMDQLKARGLVDMDSYFRSKTVRVTGTISKFTDKWQIEVDDVNQIQFVTPAG